MWDKLLDLLLADFILLVVSEVRHTYTSSPSSSIPLVVNFLCVNRASNWPLVFLQCNDLCVCVWYTSIYMYIFIYVCLYPCISPSLCLSNSSMHAPTYSYLSIKKFWKEQTNMWITLVGDQSHSKRILILKILKSTNPMKKKSIAKIPIKATTRQLYNIFRISIVYIINSVQTTSFSGKLEIPVESRVFPPAKRVNKTLCNRVSADARTRNRRHIPWVRCLTRGTRLRYPIRVLELWRL